MAPESHDHRLLRRAQNRRAGSVGPVLRSFIVSRLRHLTTVLTLMPSSRLSAAVVACASRDHAAHNPVSQWIAVLLLRLRAWSWRSREGVVPKCSLPFQRTDRTIKPWEQTPRQVGVVSNIKLLWAVTELSLIQRMLMIEDVS